MLVTSWGGNEGIHFKTAMATPSEISKDSLDKRRSVGQDGLLAELAQAVMEEIASIYFSENRKMIMRYEAEIG